MLAKTSLTILTVLLTLTLAVSANAGTGDVVYIAQTKDAGPNELFHVNAKSGAVTKLNGALAEGGNVTDFILGPRGRQVAYRADQETDEVFELYHVSLNKKSLADVQQTKLNGELNAGGDVFAGGGFAFGPKGRQLVYNADQDTDQVGEIYHVSLDKKNLADVQQTKLNSDLAVNGDVFFGFAFGPKGRQLAYWADQDTNSVKELYHVSLDKKNLADVQQTKLNGDLGVNGDVSSDYTFGPKGRQLVYRADQDTDQVNELYLVSLDKQNLADVQQTKLNAELVADGAISEFAFGPKGRQLVYVADQDTDQVNELYHVSLDKQDLADVQQTKLNGELATGGSIFEFTLEPKGRQLVYRADQDTDDVNELYLVSLDKKSLADVQQTKLNGDLGADGDVESDFAFGPKGRQFIYTADQDTDSVRELYHVSLDKKNLADVQQTKLNGGIEDSEDVFKFELGPKGRQLVYRADQDVDGVLEIYYVSLDKKNLADVQQTKLNGDLVGNEDVFDYAFEPKGRQLVYLADQDTDQLLELYQVDLGKKSLLDVMQVRLNGAVAGSGVSEYSIAP